MNTKFNNESNTEFNTELKTEFNTRFKTELKTKFKTEFKSKSFTYKAQLSKNFHIKQSPTDTAFQIINLGI